MSSPALRPTIDVLRAPAASGKTEQAISLLCERRRGLAIALVPNASQLVGLRDRLGPARHVHVMQFFTLASTILKQAGMLPPLLEHQGRHALVRTILADLRAAGRLPTYGRVALKPGFSAAVATLLDELGNADITPAVFAAAAQSPHDAEIAAVYERYEQFQAQNAIADLPRRLRLARDALRSATPLFDSVELLVVDGFDQFTPLQLSLLVELAWRVPELIITLTGEERDRPAHRRFHRTFGQLGAAFDLRLSQLASPINDLPRALHQLETHLFELDQPPDLIPADGAVMLIEAADREREVRAVLRQVQRLVMGGAALDSIAILFRDGSPYERLLQELAGEYQLPLDLAAGLPLGEAPPIAALLGLLRLPLDGYPRRALVEALRSPYLAPQDLSDSQAPDAFEPALLVSAAYLDAAARHTGVSVGLARWTAALDRLASIEQLDQPEDDPLPPIYGVEAATLRTALIRLADWLTPPDVAPIAQHIAWLRTRRAAIQIASSQQDDQNQPRDAAALQRFDQLLEELERAANQIGQPSLPFPVFLASLEAAVGNARFHLPERPSIIARSALEARGRVWEHVCILGLSEGQFPQPLAEPAIYSRSERRAMSANCGLRLPFPEPADERTIFYEAVTRARRTLLLSRTRLDEVGTPLPRSPYLTALLGLLEGVETISVLAGSVPGWDEAASPQERALALAELLSQPAGERSQPKQAMPADQHSLLAGRIAALSQEYPAWKHIMRARQVEAAREGLGRYGPYEGALDDPQLAALIAARFGAEYQWSTTQLNDYLTCPFRFAAAHVIGLRPRNDPDEGLDGARRGQIYHAILARAGRRWRQAGIALTEAHAQVALEHLDAAAAGVLADAPERFGFAPSAFWTWEQAELQRRLQAALRSFIERGGGGWTGFAPLAVEQSFGGRRGARPLRVPTPQGEVLVRGRIDRVDQRPDGALAVIDYKSGASPRPTNALSEGRDVQLPIYILAVEQVLPIGSAGAVERAAFLHIGSGKRAEISGETLRQTLEAAQESLARAVAAVQRADFRVRPSESCPEHCVFEAICRRNLAKARNS